MSKGKDKKIRIELQREDWRAMGIPRKQGGAGPHGNRSTKRKRTRKGRDADAIQKSLDAYEDDDDNEDAD